MVNTVGDFYGLSDGMLTALARSPLRVASKPQCLWHKNCGVQPPNSLTIRASAHTAHIGNLRATGTC
eukprot:2758621-Amphidinium_carterae.1